MHTTPLHSPKYIGRFAPSPSGPLHLGSLACALASYFDAKCHHGKWLLRIEDIDPPREPQGAAQAIAQCLLAHGLFWDGDIAFQSQRSAAYRKILDDLSSQNLTFYCQCTRKQLSHNPGCYNGHCRQLKHPQGAIRLNIEHAESLGFTTNIEFNDAICGPKKFDLKETGDFVVHRKDGLFAYQLAVVADDISQGITHVVRGNDLIEATYCQLMLFRILNAKEPSFCHIPVLLDSTGRKLSKQNGAPAIDITSPLVNLTAAMHTMGLKVPNNLPIQQMLLWGIHHWPATLKKLASCRLKNQAKL